MNKTKTIYFLSAIVLIIGCYALNLSYSLFVQTESKDIVNATVPVLSYNLEQSEFIIPANSSELITLKINNTGTTDINYGISTTLQDNVTVQLVDKTDNEIIGTALANNTKDIILYVTNNNEDDIPMTFNIIANYSTVALSSDLEANSNIDTINKVKLLKDTIIANAKSTELTYENKTFYSEILETTPAEEISDENERLLLEAEDDYTSTTGQNSYYFRGNVQDNYVNFADMCWRIIRIAGDGSIKLILEDKSTTCNDTTYTGNWSIDKGYYGVGRVDMVFVDELSHKMNYLEPISDFNPSMVNALYNFQEEDLGLYDRLKLKPGDWCLNNNAYEIISSTPYKYNKLPTLVDGYNSLADFYYDSYIRLSGNNESGYQPTLKCNSIVINKFADEMDMYVGAITADEVVYAGSKHSNNTSNTKFSKNYLLNNYQTNNSENFWTLSPSSFNNDGSADDHAYVVSSDSFMYQNHVGLAYNAFRPVINLSSNVVAEINEDFITNGYPGTQSNPYVIK